MAKKAETTAFTFRAETKKWRAFGSILTLQGITAAEVFSKVVDDYLEQHKSLLPQQVIDELFNTETDA